MSAENHVSIDGHTYYAYSDSDSDRAACQAEQDCAALDEFREDTARAAASVRRRRRRRAAAPSTDEAELDELFGIEPEEPSHGTAGVCDNADDFVAARVRVRAKKRKRVQTEARAHNVYSRSLSTVRRRRDMDWTMENDPDEKAEVRDAHRKPCTTRFQVLIETLLRDGEDPDSTSCWGCKYGDSDGKGLNATHWNNLVRAFCNRLYNTQPHILGQELHTYFVEHCITEVSRLAKCAGEQDKVQLLHDNPQIINDVWTPYQIIQHFFKHELAPQVVTAVELWFVNDAVMLHMESGLSTVHDVSGRTMLDKEGVDMLDKLIKLQTHIYSRMPKKMMAYNPNMMLPEEGYSVINDRRPMVRTHTADTSVFRQYTGQ